MDGLVDGDSTGEALSEGLGDVVGGTIGSDGRVGLGDAEGLHAATATTTAPVRIRPDGTKKVLTGNAPRVMPPMIAINPTPPRPRAV